jgi:hypothetical protein
VGAGGKIGDWDESTLIRFLRDFQDQQPQTFFDKLRINQLQIETLMNLKPDRLILLTNNTFTNVGDPGAPVFKNAWVNFAAGEALAGYWRDPFGFVTLKGVIKTGTINTACFTLPPGYRPLEKQLVATISNGAIGRLDVTTAGAVIPVSGNNAYFALNNISFPTTNV